MVAQLVDENGNRRSREEFRQKALEIDSTYNTRYLDVEYDTAVRQARSADQWQQAQATKHLFPNIKYMPSVSAKKREDHIRYYGLVRPIDDPIWNTILPPNGWECKCRWQQTDEQTNNIPDNLPPPTKGFDFNPGKTGEIFKLSGSEYEKAVKDGKTKGELLAMAKRSVDFDMAAELPYINIYDSKSGTDVLAHPLAFYQNDFQENITYARKMANAKEIPIGKIEILPTLYADVPVQRALRSKLLPEAKGGFNPDYRIDGKYIDLKIPDGNKPGKNTIQNLFKKANEQGEGIFLVIEKEGYISENDLYHDIYLKYMHDSYEKFSLYLLHNGNLKAFTRESFLKFYKK